MTTKYPLFAPLRTSSFSGGDGCVSVGSIDQDTVAVVDTKSPDGPIFRFSNREWEAFVAGAKAGEFNLSGEGGN